MRLVTALLVLLAAVLPARADDPVIRVAVLKFGTVNWLMETITANGFDHAEGVRLETMPLAGKAATSIAFQSGDADVLVTDWIWAMRQRTGGKKLRFSPYSNALGALVSDRQSSSLCDLEGKTIGVVGGTLDKSWLVLQALADRDCGFDLAEKTETLFGAPPLMSRQLQDGTIAAVSTYWPFVARLEAAGMVPLVRIDEALEKLGIAPPPPLIGFVWDEARADTQTVQRFLAAVAKAGALLAQDDTAWEALRPLMRAKSDAEFSALRDAYRAGIPNPWIQADTDSSRKLYDLLTRRAGPAFTDQAGPFDPTVFPDP